MATRAHRRVAPSMKQEQHDDDSDTEETHLGLGFGLELEFRKPDGREPQIIHSGHFMVSTPHIEHPPKKGYDFDTVNKQTCQTYHFGKASASHLSIDASLTKLFECMTLAYRRVHSLTAAVCFKKQAILLLLMVTIRVESETRARVCACVRSARGYARQY